MSSPNKNSQRKEVIFKSSIFLSLLLFSILIASYLARGTPPKTTDAAELNQYYAYCYDTADKLAAKLKSSATDHYGRTWKSYGASVDTSKRYIVPKSGKNIDLTTLCNGKTKGMKGWEEDKKTIPFRYYFWVKPAKIRSSNTYYHTQGFVATYNKLTEKNCWQHQSKGDGVEVPRIEVALSSNEFLTTIGVHNGGQLGLDMFLVNFQNVYEKSKTDLGYDLSNGYIYFHSVAEVFTNGVQTASNITDGGTWLSKAYWLSENDIVNHYNQYIHFGGQGRHDLRFFRIQTTDKSETTAKLGDYDSKKLLWSTGEKPIEVYNDSVLELKGIKTYKKDNKTYYLKGIRICNRGETDTDKGHFYILTNTFKGGPLATREGADKKTDKYCKSDGSGYQLDKLSEKTYNYAYKYKFQFTRKENGAYKYEKEVLSKDPGTVTNPKNPGKKSNGSYKELDWETLTDHMVDLSLKTGSEDQDIYLIYEAQNKGQVKVQKAYYDHTDESETDGISSYEKVEEDEEPKVLGDFKADDDTAKYSIKDAITLERRKIIDNTNNNLGFTWNQYSNLNDKVSSGTASQAESDKFADWNEQIRKHRALWSYHNRKVKDTKGNTSSERYYARRVSVKYTSKKTGEKVEVNIGGTVKNLDALLAADSNFDNAIWSGKSDEAKALADSILKVLRAFEFDDVDKSKELLIKIDYYQSKVQYKALTYIEYMKQAFNVVYTIIYKTD